MDDQQLVETFKALSNPHRLAIMRRLIDAAIRCDRPEGNCDLDSSHCGFGELVEDLGITKATASHHLKELHRANLIERERRGRFVFCRVNAARLTELRNFLECG